MFPTSAGVLGSSSLSDGVGVCDTSPVHPFPRDLLENVVLLLFPPPPSFFSFHFSILNLCFFSLLFFSFSVASSLCNRHLAKAPHPLSQWTVGHWKRCGSGHPCQEKSHLIPPSRLPSSPSPLFPPVRLRVCCAVCLCGICPLPARL